ncbi:MAG: hypothetical protein WDZ84_07385 [Rhodovibrionaceae bacterium]
MSETIREAVGVFHDPDAMEKAIADLEAKGFDRAEISLLARDETVEQKLGHRYEKVEDLKNSPETPRRAYVDKTMITEAESGLVGGLFYVGAIAAAGATVATGGGLPLILGATLAAGGVLAKAVDREESKELAAQLERGGLLLWVRLRADQRDEAALSALRGNGAGYAEVHCLPVASAKAG